MTPLDHGPALALPSCSTEPRVNCAGSGPRPLDPPGGPEHATNYIRWLACFRRVNYGSVLRTQSKRRGADGRAAVPGCLLIPVHDLDQRRLAPCAAEDLKSNRQAVTHEPHRNGDRGEAGRGRQAWTVVAMWRVEVADHARRKGPRRIDERVERAVIHHLLHGLAHPLHVLGDLRAARVLVQRRLCLTVDKPLLDRWMELPGLDDVFQRLDLGVGGQSRRVLGDVELEPEAEKHGGWA